MVKIKICGITNVEDAILAANLGVDALGFIFYEKSPRNVVPEVVRKIGRHLPPFIFRVGVFLDAEAGTIRKIVDDCRLDAVQLHGSETPEFCRQFSCRVIKSFRIQDRREMEIMGNYDVDAFLLDSFHPHLAGGTGITFNWELAVLAKAFGKPVILSGGLNGENVASAITMAMPYAVDVASGVELAPGKKDPAKLKKFVDSARWA